MKSKIKKNQVQIQNSTYTDIWILDEFCSCLKDHEGYKREL